MEINNYGHRPQNLIKGVQVAVAQGQDAAQMAKALLAHAEGQMARDRDEFTTMYLQFGPLEQAVLRHLLEQGGKFKAFDAAAMAFYSSCLNKKVNVGAVQRALEALRTSDHTLVWKSLRSEYSVYDSALSDWYEYLKNQRQWPPQV